MTECLLCLGGEDEWERGRAGRARARACPECGRLHFVCAACAISWDLAGGPPVPGWDGPTLSRCPRADEFKIAAVLMGRRR